MRVKLFWKGLKEHPLVRRYRSDIVFKNSVSLLGSLAVNLFYVGANVLSQLLSGSAWFGILACYHAILALMRFLLVRYTLKNRLGSKRLLELGCARACAAILLTINLLLSGAVLMILYQGRGFAYPGVMIYAAAAYTFYITTMAIVNLVRYRRHSNPILSMAGIIRLAAALVSMLTLEAAMLAHFGGDMAPEKQRLLIILTGAGVSILIVAMALSAILRNTRAIRVLKKKRSRIQEE